MHFERRKVQRTEDSVNFEKHLKNQLDTGCIFEIFKEKRLNTGVFSLFLPSAGTLQYVFCSLGFPAVPLQFLVRLFVSQAAQLRIAAELARLSLRCRFGRRRIGPGLGDFGA
jgi:hypothetical protein